MLTVELQGTEFMFIAFLIAQLFGLINGSLPTKY